MLSIQPSSKGAVIALATAALTALAGTAEAGPISVNALSNAGRAGVGIVAYRVGTEMCPGCGAPMRTATRMVYDASRNAANRYSPSVEQFGRQVIRPMVFGHR